MAVIEYIKDLNVLLKTLQRGEVVIFPSGAEGRTLLDFLHYTGRLGPIRCVAAEKGTSANNFVHNLPIIPIGVMPQFRESATFVVAASESKTEELAVMLANRGFQGIFCLTVELNDKLKEDLKTYAAPGTAYGLMESFAGGMSNVQYSIAMQDEIQDLNTSAFEKYRGCCRGKKVVVCGCGPTLKYYNPIPDAVHISLNRAFLDERIKFDFLFAHDPGGGNKIPSIASSFKKISERIFIGKPASGGGFSEWWSTAGSKVARYFKGGNNVGQTIHRDICCHPLTDFWSIYSSGVEFAFFMHPAELYLVGCDVSMSGHFYHYSEADSTKYWLNTPVVKVGYSRLKLFGKQYYPDTKIISINPVGLKTLFEDVYTDEYKAALAAQENKSE